MDLLQGHIPEIDDDIKKQPPSAVFLLFTPNQVSDDPQRRGNSDDE